MLLSFTLALADTAADGIPTADAGLGLIAYVDDVVVLNGTASSDPEGADLTYTWTQVGGPTVSLKPAASAEPEFTVEAPGTLRFELVVNDGVNDSVPDSVEVVVAERAFGGSDGGCTTGPSAGWAACLLVGALVVMGRKQG